MLPKVFGFSLNSGIKNILAGEIAETMLYHLKGEDYIW